MKGIKRLNAILLVLAMLLSMLPGTVFAVEETPVRAAAPTAADTVLYARYNSLAAFEVGEVSLTVKVNGEKLGATWDKDYLYLVYSGSEAPAITVDNATMSVIQSAAGEKLVLAISLADLGLEAKAEAQYVDLTVDGVAIKLAVVNETVTDLFTLSPALGNVNGKVPPLPTITGKSAYFPYSTTWFHNNQTWQSLRYASVADMTAADGATTVMEFDFQPAQLGFNGVISNNHVFWKSPTQNAGDYRNAVSFVLTDANKGLIRFAFLGNGGKLALVSQPGETGMEAFNATASYPAPAKVTTDYAIGADAPAVHVRVEYTYDAVSGNYTVKYFLDGKQVLTDTFAAIADPGWWPFQAANEALVYTNGLAEFTVSNWTLGKNTPAELDDKLEGVKYMHASYRSDAAELAANKNVATWVDSGYGLLGAVYDDTYLYLVNANGSQMPPAIIIAGVTVTPEEVNGATVVRIPLADLSLTTKGNQRLASISMHRFVGYLVLEDTNVVYGNELDNYLAVPNDTYGAGSVTSLPSISGNAYTFGAKWMNMGFGSSEEPIDALKAGGTSIIEFTFKGDLFGGQYWGGGLSNCNGPVLFFIKDDIGNVFYFALSKDHADNKYKLTTSPYDEKNVVLLADYGFSTTSPVQFRLEIDHAAGETTCVRYYINGRLALTDEDAAHTPGYNPAHAQTMAVVQGNYAKSFTLSGVSFGRVEKEKTHTNVVLQLGADESQMNFTWYSKNGAKGTVAYAKADELVDGELPENATKVNATRTESKKEGYYGNKATITGLLPGTTYAYQISNGADKTQIKQFTTPAAGKTFSFAFGGDPQIGQGIQNGAGTDEALKEDALNKIKEQGKAFGRTLSQMMNSKEFSGINFFMSAGDQTTNIVNDKNGWSDYDPTLREAMWDAYSNHEEFLSLPTVTVLGNHDAYPGALYPFHVNQPNMLTKEDGSYYGATYDIDKTGNYLQSADYYFTYNNVLFLVLNTNTFKANDASAEDTAADLAAAQDHGAFIDRVLEETSDLDIDWTIVLYHQSPYGSSYHNNDTTNADGAFNRTEQYAYINMRKFLVPKLYEAGVDVVLSGHDHCYTRTHILKPATDEDGNYIDASVIVDDSYEYVEGKTSPVKVTNPDGILHITAATSSGSQVNGVEYTSDYTAVTAKANTRHLSRIDITENELTIVTYNMGTDTTESITEVDRFTIAQTEHRNAYEVEEQAPTCNEVGYTAGKYCPDCETWIEGHEEIEALNHKNATTDEGTAPTCDAIGYTAGKYCPDCKTWIEGHEEIEALNHKNATTDEGKDATCDEAGYTAGKYCPDCKTWIEGHEEIEALNHKNATTDDGKDATCDEAGYTAGKYCPDCEEWIEGHEEIEALNHKNATTDDGKDATCGEAGYTAGKYCPDCEEWIEGHEPIEALNHKNATTDEGTAPTCDAIGYTAGKYCPDCKTWIEGHEEVSALNHKNAYAGEAKDASCTENGNTAGTYCPDCEKWTEPQETIPATNHKNAYEVKEQAPTCNEVGYTAGKYCPDCKTWIEGHEEIDALNHKNATTDEGKDATCDEVGYTAGKYCPDCEEWIEGHETIEALNHKNAYAGEAKDASCTENGNTAGTYCPDCEEWIVPQETITAPGHTNGTPVKEHETDSTCTVAGTYDEVVYCTVCEKELSRESKTKELAEHKYGKTDCTANSTCSVCGDIKEDAGEHEYAIDGDYILCKHCDAPLRKQMIELDDGTYLTAYSGKILKDHSCYWDGEYCKFDIEGKLIVVVIDETKTGIYNEDGVDYFYRNGLVVRRELVKWEGHFYLTNYDGKILKNHSCNLTNPHEDLPAGEHCYTFGADGKMMDGIYVIDGEEYLYRDGSLVRRELVEIEGKYYLTAYSGRIQKKHSCYLTINGESVYCEFDEVTGELINIQLEPGMGFKR